MLLTQIKNFVYRFEDGAEDAKYAIKNKHTKTHRPQNTHDLHEF